MRIHVERVIGHLKIFERPSSSDHVEACCDIEVSNFAKILTVCAALSNLTGSIV